jgi:hypothetical protein
VSACPTCNERAERHQLVCLRCGTRLALEPPSPPRRRLDNLPAVILLLTVVVLGAGACGFAVRELTDDNDADAARPAAAATTRPGPAAGEGKPQTETAAGTIQQPSQSPLLAWPPDLTAYTVVLVTSGDRGAVRRVAVEAAKAGVEAGLLRADDFGLGTDLWIAFAGRFDTQASAESQAANLAERYPGAYATLVKPSP